MASIQFFKSYETCLADIYEEDVLKATIKHGLRKFQHPIAENEVILDQTVESIIADLNGGNSTNLFKRLVVDEFDLMQGIVQKYCAVAAVAAYWETQIKFFSGKSGIDVYRNSNPGEHVETKHLGLIIDDFCIKFPKVKANFKLPRDIRNCLLHGNLQQLRILIEPTLNEKEKKDLDPKMAILNTKEQGPNRIRYANDRFTKNEAKKMGPFFWFLSQGNTRLLSYAANILENSLMDIKRISAMHAFSHHETQGYFEQLAIRGQSLSKEQQDTFIKTQGHHISDIPEVVRKELDQILSLFSN